MRYAVFNYLFVYFQTQGVVTEASYVRRCQMSTLGVQGGNPLENSSGWTDYYQIWSVSFHVILKCILNDKLK